MIILFR